MQLHELLACLALIYSAFVCVVVHVIQKGYPIWWYGGPFQLGICISPFSVGDMAWPLSGWGHGVPLFQLGIC